MKNWLLLLSFISINLAYTQSFTGNWAKVEYIDCLNDSLPYQCFVYKYPPFLTYDSSSIKNKFFGRNKIDNYFTDSKISSFNIINQFKEFNNKTSNLVATVKIQNDTMFYFQYSDSTLYKYIPLGYDRWDYENKKCLDKINHLLLSNGHKNIYKTLKSKSLSCNCDWQYGVNIVYTKPEKEKRKRYKCYRVEYHNKELTFYKWRYPKEGKRGAKSTSYKRFY